MQRSIQNSHNPSQFCIKHPKQIKIIQTGYISTNNLTTRTRALLEQPTVSQLIMKFQAFREIRLFITMSTTADNYSLCSVKFFQSQTFDSISLRYSLILFSQIRLGHRSSPFSSSSAHQYSVYLLFSSHLPQASSISTSLISSTQ